MPIEIVMPALSPTMERGKLANWQVKVGDKVEAGDVLAEIETDKALVELEAAADGEVGKLLIENGTADVAVNTPIAYLLGEGEEASALEGLEAKAAAVEAKAEAKPAAEAEAKPATPVAPVAPVAQAAPATPAPPKTPQAAQGGRIAASPLARRLAHEKGLNLASIAGSGPSGRIIKRDIDAARHAPAPVSATASGAVAASSSLPDPRLFFSEDEYEVEALSPMMAGIAQRLQAAKQEIPHYQVSMDVPLDKLMLMRAKLNDRLAEAETGQKLTLNDFIMRAAALALMDVPEINRSFGGDSLLQYKNADISVAVALPNGGLITPIVKQAQNKSVQMIAAEIKDLAKRASELRLKPEEYEGGTFTVSNLGMFGVAEFSAIINPPQSAILAIGGATKRAVVGAKGVENINEMRVTLSADHRVINGAQAAQFLAVFRDHIAAPLGLLF